LNVGDGSIGQRLVLSQAKTIVRIKYIYQVVGDERKVFPTGLGRADIHLAVNLAAVGTHYLSVKGLRQAKSQLTLTDGTGTNYSYNVIHV
jgi:hypothetical protein